MTDNCRPGAVQKVVCEGERRTVGEEEQGTQGTSGIRMQNGERMTTGEEEQGTPRKANMRMHNGERMMAEEGTSLYSQQSSLPN